MNFFWLHIKKSAGQTLRDVLNPYYKVVDRSKYPKCFIQATEDEYNDILNNYRTPLGQYQFKRTLFAKQYLYKDWDSIYSFAFSREPIDRCKSMFFYLNKNIDSHHIEYQFDVFLEKIIESRESDSVYQPYGNHFSTHTAKMYNDITDNQGDILLKKIFKVECMEGAINQVFVDCGINKSINSLPYINKNNIKRDLTLGKEHIKKIEYLFNEDFNIYENAIFYGSDFK